MIALLSNLNRPVIDRPSNSWLGHAASREAIRESGLWNVNHVDGTSDDTFLTMMEKHLNQHSRTDGP